MLKRARELPSLDLLKGFEAAARNLSFTKAAAELFVTQSAISRQVPTLEDQLGVALFRRHHRDLRLTEEGQTFYKTTGEVLRLLRDVTGRLGARPAGMLTVTTTVSFAGLWLVPRLNDFRRLHPGIDMRLAATNEIQDLGREGIDLAIRYCTPKAAGRSATRLFGELVFPVCSKSALAGRKMKSPQDLSDHVLLHYDVPARPEAHLYRVTCTVAQPDSAGQRFALPAWVPGSYMIRDFARHIVSIRAASRGRAIAIEKLDKHTWRAEPAAGPLAVNCEVYAWDLSVRGAHLDTRLAFFNGACVFLRVLGREAAPCELEIVRPR